MSTPSKTPDERWEAAFDDVVALAAARRLGPTLASIGRLRAWQRRQSGFGATTTHAWHQEELYWLEATVLARAGRGRQAARVCGHLARQVEKASAWTWRLPRCARCLGRALGFARNWSEVDPTVRGLKGDALAGALRAALSAPPGPLPLAPSEPPAPSLLRVERASAEEEKTRKTAKSLRDLEATIKNAYYADAERPATLVALCERYLRLDAVNARVWAYYGHTLVGLERFADAETALTTARGLMEDLAGKAFVLRCRGDLENARGRIEEAERSYRESVEVEPKAYWGFVLLGRALRRQDRTAEAEKAYRQATEEPSDYRGAALEELAGCLLARGAFFEARATLGRALKLSLHPSVRARCEEALADVEGALRSSEP